MSDLRDLLDGLPKSTLNIGLSFLVFLSLGSIHYVTYAMAFPTHLRVLLDTTFKFDFAANFTLVATFSIIVARYLPQTVLSIGTFLVWSQINIEYYRRGYRRVASPLGLFESARLHDKEEKVKFEKRLARFGRNDARLDNFFRRRIQARLPIVWYENQKWQIMTPLAILVCLWFYIGFIYSLLMVLFFLVIFVAHYNYIEYSDSFAFRLKGTSFRGDDPDYSPPPFQFSSQRLFVVATTCAVIFAIAGPLRLSSQTKQRTANVVLELSQIEAVMIGATGNGLLIYSQRFEFVPFSSIQRIE